MVFQSHAQVLCHSVFDDDVFGGGWDVPYSPCRQCTTLQYSTSDCSLYGDRTCALCTALHRGNSVDGVCGPCDSGYSGTYAANTACILTDCSSYSAPAGYVKVSYCDTAIGTTCDLQCDTTNGYSGTAVYVICQSNGQWTSPSGGTRCSKAQQHFE